MGNGRSRREFDDALDLIGEASLREDLWDEVPNVLARVFRAKTVSLYFQNERQRSGRLERAETAVTEGYDNSTLDSYATHYYTLNPYHHRPEFKAPGQIITDERLPTDLSAGEREYLEDWVRPQGVRHVMGQMLDQRSSGALFLVAWRGREVGAYNETEKYVFNRVLHATNRALHTAERLHAAEAAFSAAAAQLGMQGIGVVVLAADGRVLDYNGVADTCFAERDGLVLRGGRLDALQPTDQLVLQRFIGTLLDPNRALSGIQDEIVLRRTNGRPSLRIEGVRLRGRHSRFGPNLQGSVILLLHLPRLKTPDSMQLRQAWGLTPAEARLALLLIAPVPFMEATLQLGITRETARSHLKALFAKTSTHSQTELVVRVMSVLT